MVVKTKAQRAYCKRVATELATKGTTSWVTDSDGRAVTELQQAGSLDAPRDTGQRNPAESWSPTVRIF
eukprot:SAG22_NODE_783_length_7251_cov_18.263423_7_plen_68_part_00